jgi:hypothetical protein
MSNLERVSKLTGIKVKQLSMIREDGYYYSNRSNDNATKHLLKKGVINPVFDSSGKKVRGVYFIDPVFKLILDIEE